ncbi:MAG: hypothetical protein V1664_00825 [Candidatus Uhrbacteria bacterium]
MSQRKSDIGTRMGAWGGRSHEGLGEDLRDKPDKTKEGFVIRKVADGVVRRRRAEPISVSETVQVEAEPLETTEAFRGRLVVRLDEINRQLDEIFSECDLVKYRDINGVFFWRNFYKDSLSRSFVLTGDEKALRSLENNPLFVLTRGTQRAAKVAGEMLKKLQGRLKKLEELETGKPQNEIIKARQELEQSVAYVENRLRLILENLKKLQELESRLITERKEAEERKRAEEERSIPFRLEKIKGLAHNLRYRLEDAFERAIYRRGTAATVDSFSDSIRSALPIGEEFKQRVDRITTEITEIELQALELLGEQITLAVVDVETRVAAVLKDPAYRGFDWKDQYPLQPSELPPRKLYEPSRFGKYDRAKERVLARTTAEQKAEEVTLDAELTERMRADATFWQRIDAAEEAYNNEQENLRNFRISRRLNPEEEN